MKVTNLAITNLRAIENAEFQFQPGFNLIVGVNGVGKSSVLKALAVDLSAIIKGVNRETRTTSAETFDVDDIRFNANALSAECQVNIAGEKIAYLTHKPRKSFLAKRASKGLPRAPVIDIPEIHDFLNGAPRLARDSDKGGRPFALFFGVGRASDRSADPTRGSTYGGVRSAVSGAFRNRSLRIAELVEWLRVQQRLRKELPQARRVMAALEKAVHRFLPGYENLRVVERPHRDLVIDCNGETLPVRHLSDGERGVLAIVVDLTRRLALANPSMADPAAKAEAVVLIDEIELHLHPTWQRTVVSKLRTTFPSCQFIATTHSPQIVASVAPEQVVVLTRTGAIHPDRSLGMDSNWILRHLMETDERPSDADDTLAEVRALVHRGAFAKARAAIVKAKKVGFELPEWSELEARMARLSKLK